MAGIVAANPPQRNCYVYNETHYSNFEIGLTLANHFVSDETFEFLVNLEPADDSSVISDGEIIFPEIPAYDINKDFWSYIYHGDSNEETFLNSLDITFQDCVKIEKDTRNQSDCSLWCELHKPRSITSSIYHRIFICQRNFDTLCTETINPGDIEDLPAKVKEALNHGEKFESGPCELYIDVMRLKLRHLVLASLRNSTIPVLVSMFNQMDLLSTKSVTKSYYEIKRPHTKRHMSTIDLVKSSIKWGFIAHFITPNFTPKIPTHKIPTPNTHA